MTRVPPRTGKSGIAKRAALKLGGKMKVVPMHSDAMTIDQALRVLQDAKRLMGGNRCLILSLTGSGIEDANVNGMAIQIDGDSAYVEVRCDHPSLREGK